MLCKGLRGTTRAVCVGGAECLWTMATRDGAGLEQGVLAELSMVLWGWQSREVAAGYKRKGCYGSRIRFSPELGKPHQLEDLIVLILPTSLS